MRVAAVVDTDGSYDPNPGYHHGCFGWVDGTLYLGTVHHARIIAGMIENGQHTWETLMTAKQMWGWYEIDSSDEGSHGTIKAPCPNCGEKSLIHDLDPTWPQYSSIECTSCYGVWTPGDPEYAELAPKSTASNKFEGQVSFSTDDAMQSVGVKGKVVQALKEAFPFVNKWSVVGVPSTTQSDYGQRTRRQYFGED